MRPLLASALLALILAFALLGCGASALATQADLIALGGIAAAQTDEVIVSARRADLDAIVDAAEMECGSGGGCNEERSAFHQAALSAGEASWDKVRACFPVIPQALRAWIDGIDTARAVATDDIGIRLLVTLGGRFIRAYEATEACIEKLEPGVDVPDLPAAFLTLRGGAS